MRDFDINTIDPLSLPARSYADRRYLPALSAVYFVIASRDIVYIGQSRNLFKRWRGHPIATRMGDVDFSVAYMEIREADLIMIEAALIERFKPHLNLNRGPYLINDEPKSSASRSAIPEQVDVKAFLSEVVSRGARKRIASRLHIVESDLSRRFSVHDERKSGIAEGLREILAIAHEDADAFRKVKAFFLGCLDSLQPPDKVEDEDIPLLVSHAHWKAGEVIRAWIEDKPVHVQIRLATEAIVALQKFQVAVSRQQTRMRKTG